MKYLNIIFLLFIFTDCRPILSKETKDIPLAGEGIYAFLRRNNRDATNDYEAFIKLNKDKLGRDNSLLKGTSYTLPTLSDNKRKQEDPQPKIESNSKIKKEPLFGKQYENYTIKSGKLKGTCFYLSSGHGGPDPGAIGYVDGHELHEHEYAYDITLRLARCLLEEGATVHIIVQHPTHGIRDDRYLKNSRRSTCMGETMPLNQLKRLQQRSDKINSLVRQTKADYKRAIFIHVDSRSKKKQLDVFFYYAKNSKGGKKLANTMRETFASHYDKHQPNRGFSGTVSMRELYVLSNTTPVALYAELGNIQNSFDQRRFLDPNNRQALANWMCRGLIRDYENSK